MPRDIPIGNGRLLINFDSRYQIRDFYYPHVGDENHSAGHPFHFGVWCDGQTSWASGDDWTRSLDYLDETLVTDVHLEHKGLQLSLRCQDAVDFYETIYLRRIYLTIRASFASSCTSTSTLTYLNSAIPPTLIPISTLSFITRRTATSSSIASSP